MFHPFDLLARQARGEVSRVVLIADAAAMESCSAWPAGRLTELCLWLPHLLAGATSSHDLID
jgi:hypothetical protein